MLSDKVCSTSTINILDTLMQFMYHLDKEWPAQWKTWHPMQAMFNLVDWIYLARVPHCFLSIFLMFVCCPTLRQSWSYTMLYREWKHGIWVTDSNQGCTFGDCSSTPYGHKVAHITHASFNVWISCSLKSQPFHWGRTYLFGLYAEENPSVCCSTSSMSQNPLKMPKYNRQQIPGCWRNSAAKWVWSPFWRSTANKSRMAIIFMGKWYCHSRKH